jgi:hypothetical protein
MLLSARMAEPSAPRFWSGPITEPAQALRITTAAGWTFVVVGGLEVLAVIGELIFGHRPSPRGVIEAVLLVSPGALLTNWPSRVAAGVSFAFSVVVAVWALAIAALLLAATLLARYTLPIASVMMSALHPYAISAVFMGFGIGWLCLARLSWRALQAAAALRRIGAQTAIAP